MRPRERRETSEQDLFRSRLDQIIDMKHALVKLGQAIDWRFLAIERRNRFKERLCPGCPRQEGLYFALNALRAAGTRGPLGWRPQGKSKRARLGGLSAFWGWL
jgi:hypothetical protein